MAINISVMSNAIAPDLIGCPRVLIDKAVLDAVIKFYEDTHLRELGFEHNVVPGDIAAADNDSINVNVATYVADGRPVLLTEFRIDGTKFDTAYIELKNDLNDIDEVSIAGVVHFNFPDSTHIKFYNIEAKAQRFYIKAVYVPLSTATTVDDDFYYRWHKAVEAGAKAELMAMPRKDWTDGATALYNKSLFNDGVARAITKKDNSFSKGSMRPASMRWF